MEWSLFTSDCPSLSSRAWCFQPTTHQVRYSVSCYSELVEPEPHLITCWKCRTSGHTPDLLHHPLHFNKILEWFVDALTFKGNALFQPIPSPKEFVVFLSHKVKGSHTSEWVWTSQSPSTALPNLWHVCRTPAMGFYHSY